MEQGINILSVIPVRTMPSHTAEMCTQILFGETFEIEDKQNKWLKIKTDYDNYSGWIELKQCCFISSEEYKHLKESKAGVVKDLYSLIYNKSKNLYFSVFIGSSLPGIQDEVLQIAGDEYVYEADYALSSIAYSAEEFVSVASQFVNTPYLWGGRTPAGIDCSGFTQLVMKLFGVKLMRDASQQVFQGETVNFISEAIPGDLAFFENEEGNVVHTGILLNNQKIIHASGKVRIDDIDHFGIYNNDVHEYTHKLKIIKRFF